MKSKIDINFEINNIINDIKKYFASNGLSSKAVIGISGGKDSTIAAALLVRALGKDRVIGVMMPESVQTDIDDSRKVCEILGIKSFEIDIGPACEKLYKNFQDCTFGELMVNPQIRTNTPARIRMATLYMVASSVGGRVINTGNASELYVGYTTKYGDLAGDYAIFKYYYVREVLAIGDALEELPYKLVHKAPSDGMSGKTDEDNLGFTYEQVDALLLDEVYPDFETYTAITNRHNRNTHKQAICLPSPRPNRNYGNEDEQPWDFEF